MNRKLRHDGGRQAHQTDVLNDQRIDTATVEQAEIVGDIIQLPGEDEGIERHISLHAVAVAKVDDLGEGILSEVVGADTGIESGQSEEDSVRPVGHGGLETVPASGGGKQFGRGRHRRKRWKSGKV